ncbi:unnamed protein product [Pedinophyceae sp. YPF-701]|nr:unnamed protein product [Pedinophyceae sp. YPF-701]
MSGDAHAEILLQDLAQRLRELVQDAQRFQRRSKSPYLTVANVEQAMRMRGVEPVYGVRGERRAKFKRAVGKDGESRDVMLREDPVVPVAEIREAGLPQRVPVDANFTMHWLAVEGIQPAIPENVPLATKEQTAGAGAAARDQAAKRTKVRERIDHLGPVRAKATGAAGSLPFEHSLSAELQVYYDRVMSLIGQFRGGSNATTGLTSEIETRDKLLSAVCESLTVDPGLQQLLPHLLARLAAETKESDGSDTHLSAILSVMGALCRNATLDLELYVDRPLQCAMIILLGPHGPSEADRPASWRVRDRAARVIADLIRLPLATPYDMEGRVAGVALRAACAEHAPARAVYGAVALLGALGDRAVLQAVRASPIVAVVEAQAQAVAGAERGERRAAGDVEGEEGGGQDGDVEMGDDAADRKAEKARRYRQQVASMHCSGALRVAMGACLQRLVARAMWAPEVTVREDARRQLGADAAWMSGLDVAYPTRQLVDTTL